MDVSICSSAFQKFSKNQKIALFSSRESFPLFSFRSLKQLEPLFFSFIDQFTKVFLRVFVLWVETERCFREELSVDGPTHARNIFIER